MKTLLARIRHWYAELRVLQLVACIEETRQRQDFIDNELRELLEQLRRARAHAITCAIIADQPSGVPKQ